MDQGASALFTFADVIRIIVIAGAVVVHGVLLTWWMSKQFARRDKMITDEAAERNTAMLRAQQDTIVYRQQIQLDIARVDKDLATFKSEVGVRLSLLPTRDALEAILSQRVMPMESDLRTLVIELARIGVDVEGRRPKYTG